MCSKLIWDQLGFSKKFYFCVLNSFFYITMEPNSLYYFAIKRRVITSFPSGSSSGAPEKINSNEKDDYDIIFNIKYKNIKYNYYILCN